MEALRRMGGAGLEFFPGERAVRAHPLVDLAANAWLLGIVPWIVYCSVEGFANGWWTLLSYYVRPLAWPLCAAFALPLALWGQFVGLGTTWPQRHRLRAATFAMRAIGLARHVDANRAPGDDPALRIALDGADAHEALTLLAAHLRAQGATVTHVGAVTVRTADGVWKARASAAGDAIEIVVTGRDDDQAARLLDAAEAALAGSGVLAMAGEISAGQANVPNVRTGHGPFESGAVEAQSSTTPGERLRR